MLRRLRYRLRAWWRTRFWDHRAVERDLAWRQQGTTVTLLGGLADGHELRVHRPVPDLVIVPIWPTVKAEFVDEAAAVPPTPPVAIGQEAYLLRRTDAGRGPTFTGRKRSLERWPPVYDLQPRSHP